MATTWNGWQASLLNGANIIVTPPNMNFLTDWHRQEGGTCTNNPVVLSTAVGTSTRCGDTVAGFGRTQSYPRRGDAIEAFRIQIDTPAMSELKAALNTGNPFQITDKSPVVHDLKQWGSPTFADWYANASSSGGSGGGGGGGGLAPNTHKAWGDLQKSVNRRLPAATRHASEANRATLRTLAHIHRVKP